MNNRFPPIFSLAAASLCLLFSGCAGYHLGNVHPTPFEGIRNLYIPTFINDSQEPRFAVLATNALISAIQQDGTFKVTSKDKADAVLQGRITNNSRRQQRSVNNNVLRTRELLTLTRIEYTLTSLDGKEINASSPIQANAKRTKTAPLKGFALGSSSIFLDENFQLSERQALTLAAEDAATKIVTSLTNAW